MKTQQNQPVRSGFTLVELLVSITIMVLLAGIVVGSMGYVQDKQARAKAEVQISLLSKGLEEYKMDNGAYPDVPNNNVTNQAQARANINRIFQRLYLDGVDTPGTRIFLAELDPASNGQGWITVTGGTRYITDPWGREYRYRPGRLANGDINPVAMTPDFDLWSMGKDGLTQPGTAASPYDSKQAQNLDDIRNF